ncbi:DUF624 domain-containing protein [Ornithinibacillus gellani]|uniref:YesL family protein n=1 Tax=Ornithinibacillus gellani TaxID=2293253 RepID=UPI000F46BFCE|nr:DUF624 domain-containing protein [Ornithinibacillus gellani]TQS75134.1 DUF624 domain-containing protein [Ornithinibacillus gellani]
MNMFSSTLYRITEWITRFAYIHLLWILFTLSGFVILGFFPSTVAMFSIVRDWLRGKTDIPIFQTFWNYFKQEFKKSNLLGVFVYAVTLLIVLDFYFITSNTINRFTWINIPLFAFIFLFILFLIYLFPTIAHYNMKPMQLIKNAFFIMLVSPIQSLLILLSLVSLYFIFKLLPALTFIFGGSVYAFITMWLCLHAFEKIENKQAS